MREHGEGLVRGKEARPSAPYLSLLSLLDEAVSRAAAAQVFIMVAVLQRMEIMI